MRIAPTLIVIAALAFSGMPPAQAAGTNQPADAAGATSGKKKPAKVKTKRVKVIPSSNSETANERERRLRRECQGRPNAGACLGYTR